MNNYRIAFNFPSRLRPGRFFSALDNIQNYVADKDNYFIGVKLDLDDYTMNTEAIAGRIWQYRHTHIFAGNSTSKIHAVNRDVDKFPPWDILITMSDDMAFTTPGFDNIIRNEMPADLDWLLHFPDTFAKERVCTLPITGINYYKRDDYVYYNEYYSMFCDNEQTIVAKLRNRYKYIPMPILDHNHYSNNRARKDGLYKRNDTYRADERIFKRRESINFNL